jgi:hypothetical protein
MAGFPSGADTERVGQLLEQARGAKPEVVRATMTPPAIYRDGRYALDARFLVWADDSAGAAGLVEELLADAGVATRTVVPSGRSLSETEVPRPRAAKPAVATKARRAAPQKRKPSRPARAKAKTAARRKPAAKPKPAARPKRASRRPPARRRRAR